MTKDPYKYFRVECRELLEGLKQGVLDLDKGATKDGVGGLLRLAHTLKGAARVVKLPAIAEHAHAIEDALEPHREGAGVTAAEVDALLARLDRIGEHLAEIASPAPPNAPARASTESPLETIRVEVEEMDRLLQGVTEATVQLNVLRRETTALERAHHLAVTLEERVAGNRSSKVHAIARELRESLARIGREVANGAEQVTTELEQVRAAANRLRLLPASTLFGPVERAMRDAAQSLGKRAVLSTSGGETRLDAHVLAAMRDALLHVVRNAVAHGIEPEAERKAAGKDGAGRIELSIERRANKVAFVCRDDGRGIDVEGLRRAASRRGVDAARLEPARIFELLLKGGLTTTAAVTEVSGRGIGLDVVREIAERLKGEVSVRSEAGRGATFEICVPVSLTSLTALIVVAGGVTASLPLDSVRHTLRIDDADIARSSETDSVVFEGNVIPFVPLANAVARNGSARRRGVWSAVVVDSGAALAAVGVDELRGTAEVVVRPFPKQVAARAVAFGASLDAEGNPELVLSPSGLVEAARTGRAALAERESPKLPLLVIDDSLTTRMLEQSILESAGYDVELASSAEEALVKAAAKRYGLFIVDVEMPGMDGFEFVARTRADPALEGTPAILVTSRADADDLRRGREAGARAHIAKGEFDQKFLLDTIRELVS